jgi:hypothetical protein
MHKKQSCRIVFLFHRRQPCVIASPVSLLPVLLEKIALRNVRSVIRHDRAQLMYALVNLLPRFSSRLNIRLMAAHARISAACVASMASRGPPASPLLKCNSMSLRREPANSACARRCCESSSSSDAGIHTTHVCCHSLVIRCEQCRDLGEVLLPGKTAIHRADKSSPTNRPRSSASTPLAIAEVGTCRRDFRWTTINLPARFCSAR